ncbi:hypothetical protein THRCLA_11385 [Thraustotheca clavata]|uniref:PHD-type domain-containing protein n=1 Tax=Thraustotheca clavata TaxID=74557 RepID=A0A1V9Y7X7_9STRA|nr:hypothetical protein THRCLA_11385 [Thraustotheca clavata]
MHLRNEKATLVQEYAAAILVNLGLEASGRTALGSCNRWPCVSYRHECPLFYLLQLAMNCNDMELKRICTAAIVNCSFDAGCQIQLDEINGVPLLLKLLKVNDEDVAIYAAAAFWCLCKNDSFLVRLETIYCIPIEEFKQKLSQILWSRCFDFGLSLTPSRFSSDQQGILNSDGDNLNLVFTIAINCHLSKVLKIEHYNCKSSQVQVQGQMQFKSVQKFDSEGVLIATTCGVCSKTVKSKGLECSNDKCKEIYHVRCSRWRNLDPAIIEEYRDRFCCDVCFPKCQLQYADFKAIESSSSTTFTKRDFDTLGLQKATAEMCVLQGQALEVIAIGQRKYDCSGKIDIVLVQLKYTLRSCISLCHNNQSIFTSHNLTNPWTFPLIQAYSQPTPMSINQLLPWPSSKANLLQNDGYLRKTSTELDQAVVFEFQGGNAASLFALGSPNRQELWSGLQPSRAKCMKLVSECLAKAAESKPKKKTKPHIQRTLERQPSS